MPSRSTNKKTARAVPAKKKKKVTTSEGAPRRRPQPGDSAYAKENKRRQAEWEPGFRQRIESIIGEQGGPGKIQVAAHIKNQTLQKIRKGGSRFCFLASFVEAAGVNATWLLLGGFSEPRYRSGRGIDPAQASAPALVMISDIHKPSKLRDEKVREEKRRDEKRAQEG
jgi:hypothetical protein